MENNGNIFEQDDSDLGGWSSDYERRNADAKQELKPCPFCGSEAEFSSVEAYSLDSSFYYVGCSNEDCTAMIIDGTADDWNKRSTDL